MNVSRLLPRAVALRVVSQDVPRVEVVVVHHVRSQQYLGGDPEGKHNTAAETFRTGERRNEKRRWAQTNSISAKRLHKCVARKSRVARNTQIREARRGPIRITARKRKYSTKPEKNGYLPNKAGRSTCWKRSLSRERERQRVKHASPECETLDALVIYQL